MSARVLIAPYAFKGTLTSADAASAMVRGLRRARPGWRAVSMPLADGGRGTMRAVAEARGGLWRRTTSCNAMGETIEAEWLELAGSRAVFEVAECIALTGVPAARRDPAALTTRGIGMVLRAMEDAGIREVFMGLGDTATHDGGIGLAVELGVRLLDGNGRELPPVGESLGKIAEIDTTGLAASMRRTSITAWCDVLNPLLGTDGAARRFASQKGATPEQVDRLEEDTRRYAAALARLGMDVAEIPGAGAAGGLGAGLAALLGAQLVGGADAVLDAVRFDERVADSDVVLTGEGRVDAQTLLGKGVSRLAVRARAHDRPVVVFAGGIGGDVGNLERSMGARLIALRGREEGGAERELPERAEAAAELAAAVSHWVASTRDRAGR